MEITHTISWLELIWSAVALLGLSMNLWMLNDTMVDYIHLQLSGLQERSTFLIGRAAIRTEAVKSGVQFLFLTMGIAAMTVPPNVADTRQITRSVTAAAIILAELLLVGSSILNRRVRQEIFEALGEENGIPKA